MGLGYIYFIVLSPSGMQVIVEAYNRCAHAPPRIPSM